MRESVFHPDYREEPYWWEAFAPSDEGLQALPSSVDIAIVGGGYAGLCAALEARRAGANVVVLEAERFGDGASTRNGGGVSGGVNLGKKLGGGRVTYPEAERRALLTEAAGAFDHIRTLVTDNGIDCDWTMPGRFVGAWIPGHLQALERSVESLNRHSAAGARMLPRAQQREELASDLYFGGMVLDRSALLHPAKLFAGILDLCRRAGVVLCARARVETLSLLPTGCRLETPRGKVRAGQVLIATNGYTGRVTPDLRRRLVPILSNIIVTEELPEGMGQQLFPRARMINDTPRLRTYYRLTPDGRRVMFGGRGRFGRADLRANAEALHAMMVERLPDLAGTRITHAWQGNVAFTFDGIPHVGRDGPVHFVLGCNGSGVAMMSWLGTVAGRAMAAGGAPDSAFARTMPGHALYSGTPWFLPALGGWFRLLDRFDQRFRG